VPRPNMRFRRDIPGLLNFVEAEPVHDRSLSLRISNRVSCAGVFMSWTDAVALAHFIISCSETVRYGPTLEIPKEDPNA